MEMQSSFSCLVYNYWIVRSSIIEKYRFRSIFTATKKYFWFVVRTRSKWNELLSLEQQIIYQDMSWHYYSL